MDKVPKSNRRRARRSAQPLGVMINVCALTVLLLLLSACTTMRVEFSANASCNLPSDVWREIPTPDERDLLLGLPDPDSGQPVRDHFVASRAQREAWFQNAAGHLKACIFNPLKPNSCYSRELITVDFVNFAESWVADSPLQHICIDSVMAPNTSLERTREG
jgi:hypothetical protein